MMVLQDSVCEVAINYDVLRSRKGSISEKNYLTTFAGMSDLPMEMVGEKTQGMLL